MSDKPQDMMHTILPSMAVRRNLAHSQEAHGQEAHEELERLRYMTRNREAGGQESTKAVGAWDNLRFLEEDELFIMTQ